MITILIQLFYQILIESPESKCFVQAHIAAMTIFILPLQVIFFLFLYLLSRNVTSQSPATRDTDFSCSPDSLPSCETFVTYRARSPEYSDLRQVSDLFNVSLLKIKQANNIVSDDVKLFPDQLLLIPITCGCNGTRYFFNVTYQIRQSDNFYVVSINAFQNLTNYLLVQDMNPTLNPTNLSIGVEVVFPLLCKCAERARLEKGFDYLITYVWQPKDDVSSVSSMFKTSPPDIDAENNYRNFTAAVCLPILIPVSQFPVLSQSYSFPAGNEKSKRTLIVALSTSGVLISLFVGLMVYFHHLSKKKKAMKRNSSSLETDDLIQMRKASKDENFEPKINQDKLLRGVSGCLGKPIVYDQKVITESTMNFNELYRIGGSMYKAMIDGQIFAVKKTKDAVEELKILQRVSHANLVKLMGISLDNDAICFLVYEYAENGPLDKWLHRNSSSSSSGSVEFLTWTQRVHIAFDIANGLHYMHEHTQPSIVHGDIRTSKILLNSSFKAKISNFSTARSATTSLMTKADVYAFGLVLLDLLSGKKSVEMESNSESSMLRKEIKEILEDEEKEEKLRKWMDPNLETFYPIDGALTLAALASSCTSEKPSTRPRMAEIVFNLSVLTHSYSDMYERSSMSGLETEESTQNLCPVIAR